MVLISYPTRFLLLFLMFGLLLPVAPVAAQSGEEGSAEIEPLIRFEHLTVEDGLAGNEVLASYQDSRGFLWFGTSTGLSRYDGYTFKTYTHDRNNPNSLINNIVRSITEAPDGTLWITTQSGITNFDPDREIFTPLGDSSPINDSIFFTTFIDSRGEVWFGGGMRSGLVRYQLESGQLIHLPLLDNPDLPFPARGLHAFVEASDGRLWIASETQLVSYNPSNEQFSDFAFPAGSGRNHTILIDANDQLWLGAGNGLVRFDTMTETFTELGLGRAANVHYLGPDGLLWFSADELGLVAFDTRTETVRYSFRNHIEWDSSIGFGNINTVTVDQFGVFWIGTSSGVSRFDPQHQQFSWYGYTPIENSTLTHPNVLAVEALSGTRWLVGTENELVQLDLENKVRERLLTYELVGDPNPLLFADSQETVWVGLVDQLHTLDLDTGEMTPFALPVGESGPTGGRNRPKDIYGMAESDDGSLWIAIRGTGVLKIDPTREQIEPLNLNAELAPHSGPADAGLPVTTVASGRDNTLWIGYLLPFVTRLDIASGSQQFFDLEGIVGTTESFQTYSIYEDASGIVWIATTNGLLRLDPALDEVQRIDSLPAESIMSIMGDRSGDLWLGSTHGLLRYQPETGVAIQFGRGDGLPSAAFNLRAVAVASDGHLLFGTNNGMVAFYPEQIRPKLTPPQPLITDIQLFNQSIPVGGPLLNRAVWNTDQVTLAYNQNTLSFEFAAGGYPHLDNLRYRYRLNGLEDAWTEVPSDRRYVTFGQLPPGDYTLELQAGTRQSGRDSEWNEESTMLTVALIPAWWQRVSVQVGAVALLVGLVAVGLWQRSVRLKRRNDELAGLVAERTRDLTDSEARLQSIVAASSEAILVHDNGKIVDTNAVAADLFGLPKETLIGRPVDALGLDETLAQRLIAQTDAVWEAEATLSDGRMVMLEGRSGSVPYRGHTAQVATLSDITARREREAERQQLAALEERERIGRDLHDDLGQMMGYLSMQAQTAQQQLETAQQKRAMTTLQQVADVSREAHHNIRRYILGIRTDEAANESINLRTALQLLAERMRERHDLDVTLMLPPDLPTLGLADEAEAQLLRIVQEALTNIVKHAKGAQANLFLTIEQEQLRVVIADNGQGFAHDQPLDGHFGLLIMRERAESVGGSLTIESVVGEGTQVVALLPHLKVAASAENLRNIRTLVVDDHSLYLDGLRNLLAMRGVNVVGTARDGIEAQKAAKRLKPDLILMDIDMPKRDGLEATRRIREILPDVKIVMLTVAADEERLLTALRHGASGYLLKSLEGERFFAALADVMRGETVLSPSIASQVLADIARGETISAETKRAEVELTDRQLDVLRLLAQGLSNKEIGAQLFLSVHTVKYHIRKTLEQLQFESRHQLARYAKESGIV